ncbi:hypothetical protein BC830DRAFT_1052316, partial [Chytriomyces sp. MP71]
LVSITSTADRLNFELPITLRTLLHQHPVSNIHIYVPESDQTAFADYMERYPHSTIAHERVRIIPSFDYGPSTKYIAPLLESTGEPTGVVVCDDDHVYGNVVEDLMRYFNADPSKAYGLRGWRVNKDFSWGVYDAEIEWHIVQGVLIQKPYRVGVLTANHCYVLNTAWFHPATNTDASTSPLAALTNYTGAPASAAMVDDIWLNGHLARLGIPRVVVPSTALNVDFARSMTLDARMKAKGLVRDTANDEMLGYFGADWEAEGISYVATGEDEEVHSWKRWTKRCWTWIW